jgi:hypothetical protein
LFPDLHSYQNNGVSKKITAILHENLPQGCPNDLKDSYSAKSLRKGSITELMTHQKLTGLDVCGRSGHSTGTTLDTYADKSFTVRGLRGGKALAHYRDVDANIKVPRLECLGGHTTTVVEALLDKLFVVSVSAFKHSGSLHIVLRTCMASLIMHHRSVTSQFTPANAVATKLRNASRQAGISDSRYPGESPECILDRWSEIILKDFEDRNPEIAEATTDMAVMAKVLNQQTQLLLEMQNDIRELRKGKDEAALAFAAQQQRITYLENENASIRRDFARANGKLELLKTPPQRTRERENNDDVDVTGTTGGSKSPRSELHSSPSQNAETRESPVAALTAQPRHAQVAAPTFASTARTLTYRAEARVNAESDSNKGFTVSRVIIDL